MYTSELVHEMWNQGTSANEESLSAIECWDRERKNPD